MSIESSGFYLRAKFKKVTTKPTVNANGSSGIRVTLRVVHLARMPEDDEVKSTFISVPATHKLPELVEGKFYTFPVTVDAGSERRTFVNLATHVAIQSDDE